MVEQEGLQPGYTTQHFFGLSLKITIPTFKKIETNFTYALNLPYYNTPAYDFAQIKPKAETNFTFIFKSGSFESASIQGQFKFDLTQGTTSLNVIGSGSMTFLPKGNVLKFGSGLTGKTVNRPDVKSPEELTAMQVTELFKSPYNPNIINISGNFNINNQQETTSSQPTESADTTPTPSGGGSGMGQLHFHELEIERNSGTQIGHLQEDGTF
jgi:hypothetical protein